MADTDIIPTISVKMITVGDSLPNIDAGTPITMSLDPDGVKFKPIDPDLIHEVLLPYNKILNYERINKTQQVEKKKSPVARAIVGDLLFGSVGAIVGATTGLKKSYEDVQVEQLMFWYNGK
ncbi:MAG: hypothetical protein LUB61_02275, partial [Eggerthellaceae bacterium]|nr:hypothetical protein [Eggerthellaceae bacterium]